MAMEKQPRHLLELPMDTLIDILLRLPVKSVSRIKCVSRTLLNLVDNISFSGLHARSVHNKLAPHEAKPRIMCCSLDGDLVTLQSVKYQHNDLRKDGRAIKVSSMPPKRRFLHCVFRNVFCLGTLDGECTLVNGLGERGVLRLPAGGFAQKFPSPNVDRIFHFGMGIDDETNTYKVVCVAINREARTGKHQSRVTYVFVLGTNTWRQISSSPPSQYYLGQWAAPVCVNGVVHWWSRSVCRRDRRLVSFDLKSEEFCLTRTPQKYLDSNVDIFTLRGCLAIVETRLSSFEMEIWVMKTFGDKNKWVKYYYNDNIPHNFPSHGYVGEWDHGIFYMKDYYFCSVDIRNGPINCINRVKYTSYQVKEYGDNAKVEHTTPYFTRTILIGMNNYSEALISLKHYANLDDSHYQGIDNS